MEEWEILVHTLHVEVLALLPLTERHTDDWWMFRIMGELVEWRKVMQDHPGISIDDDRRIIRIAALCLVWWYDRVKNLVGGQKRT